MKNIISGIKLQIRYYALKVIILYKKSIKRLVKCRTLNIYEHFQHMSILTLIVLPSTMSSDLDICFFVDLSFNPSCLLISFRLRATRRRIEAAVVNP